MTDFSIHKSEDKNLVFGWAQVYKDKNGKILVDHDNDFIRSSDDLENAAYDFVLKSRDGGVQHIRKVVATLVESVVFTVEKMEKMGIPKGTIPEGWWAGFKVHDEEVWKGVKSGLYPMFSVHGKGRRRRTSMPEDAYVAKTSPVTAAIEKARNR